MKKTILVVDDSPVVNRVLQLALKARYEVIPALSGKEAVELAESESPDLILMDLKMPEMNGFQVTRILRQNPTTESIPILAMSALDGPAYEEKSLQSGCDDFMVKPFLAEDLIPRIERLLKQSTDHSAGPL